MEDEINTDEIRREALLTAAHQASVAAEALLRAALEGMPVDDWTMEKLADAAKLLVEAEFDLDKEENVDLVLMHEAHVRFLNGWAT